MTSKTSKAVTAGVYVVGFAAATLFACAGPEQPSDSPSEVASLTRVPPGRGAPSPKRFGQRGYGFGPRGVPGGHGFRGHGHGGRTCGGGATGGRTGAGGAAGGTGGGAAGAGGTTGVMVCSGSPLPTPLITDFSDAMVGTSGISFGTAPNLGGGTFTYAAPGLTAPTLSLVPAPAGSTGQGLAVAENTGIPTDPSDAFSGFGLGFDMCVDASAYTGIQFTISGDPGNCSLTFAAQFSEDNSVTDDPMFGSCTSSPCIPPSSLPIAVGTTTVHFSDVTGGTPDPTVDPRALTGIQWNLSPNDGASACVGNFVVTDIRFVNDAAGGGGTGGGGMSGAGGQAGTLPVCSGSPPATALITGSAASPVGGTFAFSATGLSEPTVTPTFAPDGSIASVQVVASPGVSTDPFNAFSGLGFFFTSPSCVNAKAFSGLQFTVTGDLGTCSLNTFVSINEDQTIANGGTCAQASCVSPFSPPLSLGTSVVPFTALAGGTPDLTVDPTAVNGIGWTLNVPTDGVTAPCRASFTISNVAFTN